MIPRPRRSPPRQAADIPSEQTAERPPSAATPSRAAADVARARGLRRSDRTEEAIALLLETAADAGIWKDQPTAVDVLSELGCGLADRGEIGRGLQLMQDAVDLARPLGPAATWTPLFRQGQTLAALERHSDAAAVFRGLIGLLGEIGLADEQAGGRYARLGLAHGEVLIERHLWADPEGAGASDDLEEADDVLAAALARAKAGAPDLVAAIRTCRASLHLEAGDVGADADCEALAADLDGLAGRAEEHFAVALGLAEAVLRRRGDVPLAGMLLDRFKPPASQDRTAWRMRWLRAAALRDRAAGNAAAALEKMLALDATARVDARRRADFQIAFSGRLAGLERIRGAARAEIDRAARIGRRADALNAVSRLVDLGAKTDALTGLGNRRALQEQVAALTADPARTRRTVAVVDVDGFAAIGSSFPAEVGDRVIAAIASLLTRNTRADDSVVRWGGEEFLILSSGPVGAARLERIRLAVETFDWSAIAPGLAVTVSIGAATWAARSDFTYALRKADQNLGAAKTAGRNRVVAR